MDNSATSRGIEQHESGNFSGLSDEEATTALTFNLNEPHAGRQMYPKFLPADWEADFSALVSQPLWDTEYSIRTEESEVPLGTKDEPVHGEQKEVLIRTSANSVQYAQINPSLGAIAIATSRLDYTLHTASVKSLDDKSGNASKSDVSSSSSRKQRTRSNDLQILLHNPSVSKQTLATRRSWMIWRPDFKSFDLEGVSTGSSGDECYMRTVKSSANLERFFGVSRDCLARLMRNRTCMRSGSYLIIGFKVESQGTKGQLIWLMKSFDPYQPGNKVSRDELERIALNFGKENNPITLIVEDKGRDEAQKGFSRRKGYLGVNARVLW